MWQPGPLQTIWASTACYGDISKPLYVTSLHKYLKIRVLLIIILLLTGDLNFCCLRQEAACEETSLQIAVSVAVYSVLRKWNYPICRQKVVGTETGSQTGSSVHVRADVPIRADQPVRGVWGNSRCLS